MPAKSTIKRKAAQTPPAKPGTEVVVRQGTSVVVGMPAPGSWRERAKKSVVASKAALAKLPTAGGNMISFRGGVMSAAGAEIDSPANIVILAHNAERSYYSAAFDANKIATPDCYSFDKIAPHEQSPVPQNPTCENCHMAEYGSAGNGRDAKACKEMAHIAFIHADVLQKGLAAILAAPIWHARISVLNSKIYKRYAEALFGDEAPWLYVTTMACRPDTTGKVYVLTFNGSPFEGEALFDALSARADAAEKLLVEPWARTEEAPAAPPPRRGRKF